MQFISSIFLIVLMWNALSVRRLCAQPTDAVYPTNATGIVDGNSLTGYGVVTDAAKAYLNKPNDDGAILKAASTLQSAAIHFTFDQTISAANSPVTFYIRTDINAVNYAGSVSINAYNASNNSIATPSYQTHFLDDGSVFLAVSMSLNFKGVRITLRPSLLQNMEIKVYSAFYGPNATNLTNPYPFNSADCGLPNVTTKQSSGLTLLGNNNILNPERAIDREPTTSTYSTFSISGVNTGTLKQIFHFNGNANPGDVVRIVLAKGSSLLDVNLLKKITVQAYSGSTSVGNSALMDNLLALDLLGLFGNNGMVEVYFRPNNGSNNSPVIFDRVEIAVIINGLGISTGSPLYVYDVRRIPETPVSENVTACTNIGIANLLVSSNQASMVTGGLRFNWFEEAYGGVVKTVGNTLNLIGLTTPVIKEYYVEATKAACTIGSPSTRKKVIVNVEAPPMSPAISLTP
ncbi:hypothetical protein [Dyadobacter sp. CY312]|uniref:immunoglobulin domain-containing protein n=1 Tax=Dyadobacter sp. CY312 TaxID=2907303 RepID=UPI001F3C66AE|nr:hypothetical protein [Dyadobacter sp. CY312]MCE7039427.1 hypothetical protein [Dyadobacter sp. CY312]